MRPVNRAGATVLSAQATRRDLLLETVACVTNSVSLGQTRAFAQPTALFGLFLRGSGSGGGKRWY
jgi:hypothetical protein